MPCISSLPPSSPPSLSSQLPYSDLKEEFPSEDPFGFLAVEQKLKATRATHAPPLHTEYHSHNLFITPRKPKRHLVHSPGTSTRGTDSMPSTPSPSKPVPGTVLCATSSGVILSHTRTNGAPSSPRSPRSAITEAGKQLTTRKKKRKKKGKPLPSETSMDPEELARNLESLLPKRPVKTHALAKGKEKQGARIVEEAGKVLVEKRGEGTEGKGKARKGKTVKEKAVKAKVVVDGEDVDEARVSNQRQE
jgi:hypothetical protein